MTTTTFKIKMPPRHEIKVRKVTPSHSVTRVEKDKTKTLPRKAKYKDINTYEV